MTSVESHNAPRDDGARPKRRSGMGRGLGAAACIIVGVYLLLSPTYALLNFAAYASEAPHFLRYVAIPVLIAVGFLGTAIFASANVAMIVGSCGLSALAALFLFEALLTMQSVPVRMGMLGQLTAEQRGMLENANLVRGFTLRRLNHLSDNEQLNQSILSGFPGTRVVLCAPEENLITYTADRYGFNNPDEIYKSRVDVVLLGDSFIEGFCLPRGQDLASRLRSRGVAAAGFGIRGNGPIAELATLGRFGPILHPRHAVMAFFAGNDWENLEAERNDAWLAGALRPEADYGNPVSAAASLKRARTALQQQVDTERINAVDLLTETSVLRNFVALQQTLTRLGLVYPKISEPLPEFRETLRRAKAVAESWGGTFTLVYIPRIDRYMGALSSNFAFDQLRDLVLEAAKAESIDVIDLHLSLRQQKDPASMYAADGHFSRAGAELAAQVIADHLKAAEKSARADESKATPHTGYDD
ncbi:SGNH/GDSL hydrolase family protein [Arvimicrobium flavum]|uniref:SGNH/GDSL hydrolase family protein n=1 Tax=Arvimicrobium flavum TaxID=3393320 RepID=UPI00237A27DB|nr:GDSL-type esterase/lipase family protein [Mesorhizobium shangrilense]